MQVRDVLSKLKLGSSVAEFDENLSSYFLDTQPFYQLIAQEKDIVAGDKGTGKTAIFKTLVANLEDYDSLTNVRVIAGFNPVGSPVFQKLSTQEVLSEASYGSLWKAYILALVGNWILRTNKQSSNENIKLLEQTLDGLDLKTSDSFPATVFSRVLQKIGSFFRWRTAEIELSFDPDGKVTFAPRVSFKNDEENKPHKELPIEWGLTLLDSCVRDVGVTVWIALDRLDEAFQGLPEIEIPALRALLRTYLDLNEFSNIKLKLFLRKDLFRRITGSNFVNLSHVNARKVDIYWNDDDLKSLLLRRVRQNRDLMSLTNLNSASDEELFKVIFPATVDTGLRKPRTWVWMMRRVRDGNDVKPPRNLIELVSLACDEQLKKEIRSPREWNPARPLIEPDALRAALEQLSKTRVQDTLLAESGQYSAQILLFEGGKAEHNEQSIAQTLSINPTNVKEHIKPLLEIGFFEYVRATGTYKVPALYRFGLEITQGQAFLVKRETTS